MIIICLIKSDKIDDDKISLKNRCTVKAFTYCDKKGVVKKFIFIYLKKILDMPMIALRCPPRETSRYATVWQIVSTIATSTSRCYVLMFKLHVLYSYMQVIRVHDQIRLSFNLCQEFEFLLRSVEVQDPCRPRWFGANLSTSNHRGWFEQE